MKKIPTVMVRNPDDRAHVIWGEITPGCEWITEAEPTRKYDGTCTMLDAEGKWWARREVKDGKPIPENFVPADHDPVTGKTQGWEPIEQSPFAKFHAEALLTLIRPDNQEVPGTYELVGPRINGNPEGTEAHRLLSHQWAERAPRWADHGPVEAAQAAIYVARRDGWEGIVWHHPDGRMAKLKVKDLP